jgi:hypothetical protein
MGPWVLEGGVSFARGTPVGSRYHENKICLKHVLLATDKPSQLTFHLTQ